MVDLVLLHDEGDSNRAREIVLELDMRAASLSIQDSVSTRLGEHLVCIGVWTRRSAGPETARLLATALMQKPRNAILATLDGDAPLDDLPRLFPQTPRAATVADLKQAITARLAAMNGA